MKQPKTIGLLGLGSYSTTFYLSKLNELYHQQYGGYSTWPFRMLNANFNDINPFLPNQFETLKPIIGQYLDSLIKLEVDIWWCSKKYGTDYMYPKFI
jgi:aspartate racemase